CKKNVPPTEAFACKTCSADEQTVVLVCGACAMRHHRAHDVVEYAAMANAADIVSAMRDHLQHNITVQRHSTELHFAIGVVEGSVQRLVQDCQVFRPLSLFTKEEHGRHVKESSEHHLRS
ncbi:hypothetical protein AAVH_26392, partial [Aphelenchoides avenae]